MTPQAASPQRSYRYYDLLMALFVTVLLCSNLIGPAKLWTLGPLTFGAGVLFFPISYLFGDVLTEVYGFARARKVVWAGFAALIFSSLMTWFVLALPPAEGWPHQGAYELVLSTSPRIAAASIIGYFFGEYFNSMVLAKMKVAMQGRKLWARTIGSTVVGEAVDSVVFFPLAFYGVWPNDLLVQVILSSYAAKVAWEIVLTPVTYRLVAFFKKAEQEDHYDRDTDFTPFSLKT